MTKPEKQRLAWAVTGSGHYLRECLQIIDALPDVDLFLSKAAAEVIAQYGFSHNVPRVFYDKTASSVPVEFFYYGTYHTVVIAPATSNTIAKMVVGISDTLVTNVYAQAGKCRVPCYVFACDTPPAHGAESIESEAPRDNIVQVYPRRIDLENVEKLKEFETTTVVGDVETLKSSLENRIKHLQLSHP